MQALSNALDQQRLHHAYLFTGTRGVGKTTIARIFSKALNCEQGITSKPCGECAVCRSIDEGRFVDLIEVDAASRTKVEDTRELLENVQYAPVQGRFKVYLIDEVHMLSKSSFNALLKTLEEPPEHVKFLLATTDPHKLPITVLSRCLQFNLMRLTQTQIQSHLSFILQQEQVAYDDSALSMIAKSADGSARDSLSILDQAIAYGGGEVRFDAVQAMLGLVDQQFTLKILSAVLNQSAEEIKSVIQELAQMGVDYEALNNQLIEVLHQVSLIQILGGLTDVAVVDEVVLNQAAQALSPEKVQTLYQVALLAQQDMRMAPDIRIGFEMALLRMLAFEPGMASGAGAASQESNGTQSQALTGRLAGGVTSPQQEQTSSLPQGTSEPNNSLNPHQSLEVVADQAGSMQEETVQPTPSVQESSASYPDAPQEDMASDHLMSLKEKINLSLGKHRKPESATSTVEPESQSFKTDKPSVEPETINGAEQLPQAMFEEGSRASDQGPSADAPAWDLSSAEPENVPQMAHSAPVADSEFATSSLSDTGKVAEGVVKPIMPESEESASQEKVDSTGLLESNLLFSEGGTAESVGETVEDWVRLIQAMQLEGWEAELAQQSMLVERTDTSLVLSVDPIQAMAKSEIALEKLEEKVQAQLGMKLVYIEASGEHHTPAKYWASRKQAQQQDAVERIYQDPQVQNFMEILNMRVIDSSIQSLNQIK